MIGNNVVSRDCVRDPGTVVFASVGIIQAMVFSTFWSTTNTENIGSRELYNFKRL